LNCCGWELFLLFLCGDDIPYADTPDRGGDQKRHEFQQIIIQDLQQRKISYTVLTGTLAERIAQVKAALPKS
jgi:nicotinamide riboside kinase